MRGPFCFWKLPYLIGGPRPSRSLKRKQRHGQILRHMVWAMCGIQLSIRGTGIFDKTYDDFSWAVTLSIHVQIFSGSSSRRDVSTLPEMLLQYIWCNHDRYGNCAGRKRSLRTDSPPCDKQTLDKSWKLLGFWVSVTISEMLIFSYFDIPCVALLYKPFRYASISQIVGHQS